MNRSTLRAVILIFGLVTALVHLYLNVLLGHFDFLFTLNGLGYLALLGAFFLNLPFLAEQQRLVHFVFIGYAAVTILAWVFLGRPYTTLGYVTKTIEVLLILALWQDLRTSE